MPRYIDADALKKEIESLQITLCLARQSGKDTLNQVVFEYRKSILRIIDKQPTANVAPKSEVAREFIDAVDLNLVCAMTGLELMFFGKYAELKKKYTEEKLND